MHSFIGGYTKGYTGILWNVLGILLFLEIVFLEKHPVFIECYKLALGIASSCKGLLQYMIWQFSMQFSVEEEGGRGAGRRGSIPLSRHSLSRGHISTTLKD